MPKIKILHIYNDFNVYNGLFEIFNIMVQDIDHDKFDFSVCVFSYDKNPFGERFEKLGGKLYSLNSHYGWKNAPHGFIKLYQFLKQYKPDIVQTHDIKANSLGILAAKLAHVPVVIGTVMTLKNLSPTRKRRIRHKIIHPFVTSFLKSCDATMSVSESVKREWFNEKRSEKYVVIYPPYNLVKYNNAINNQIPDEPITGLKIGFVGRLAEVKGIPILLESMLTIKEKIPDAHLIIVGTGPLEKKLKDQASELKLNDYVHFVGFKSNVFEMLRQMDVFVVPSRSEGGPTTILEAMAMGLPVVATSVGGNPELVIDGETGILVPYNDPAKLAEAVIDLLSDRAKAEKMGKKGEEVVNAKFHPSKFTRSLEDLYTRLYEKKSSNKVTG